MSHAAGTISSLSGTSGSARIRKIVSRIYGSLAVVLGLAGVALAAFVIWLRATGRTLPDLSWDEIPAFFGPYLLATSLIVVVLGVLIFRQWAMAAIVLLCFTVVGDGLSYFLPTHPLYLPAPKRIEHDTGEIVIQVVFYAIMLIVTAAIVMADRAARRVEAPR